MKPSLLTAPLLAALFSSALLLTASPARAGDDHHTAPRHGGIVTEARHKQLELVVQPDALRLYLFDHGKPIAAQRVSGKLTVLADGSPRDLPLAVAGDALEARGDFRTLGKASVVALVKLDGKPLTARFALK